MSELYDINPIADQTPHVLNLSTNNSLIAAVRIVNLSPYVLKLAGFGTDEWLISGGIDLFTPDGSGNFQYTAFVVTPFSGTTSNDLLITVYYGFDDIPDKSNFPLVTNGGIGAVSLTAQQVVNDVSPTTFTILESTPPDIALQTLLMQNNGAVKYQSQGKTSNKLNFQIVPGVPGVSDPVMILMNEIFIDSVAPGSVDMTGAGGLRLGGVGDFFKSWQIIGNTGNGTFNHNLGVVPRAAIITLTNNSGASVPTVGSYTSTQVTVGGVGTSQWRCLIIAT